MSADDDLNILDLPLDNKEEGHVREELLSVTGGVQLDMPDSPQLINADATDIASIQSGLITGNHQYNGIRDVNDNDDTLSIEANDINDSFESESDIPMEPSHFRSNNYDYKKDCVSGSKQGLLVHVPDKHKNTFKEIRKHKKLINIHQKKLEAYKIYFREGKVPGPININIAPMNDLPDELWDMWWQIQRKAKLEFLQLTRHTIIT